MLSLFGWTTEQIAYAKRRHERMQGGVLPQTTTGVAMLKAWWQKNNYPEPLSVALEGVAPELDTGWAVSAVCSTAAAVPYLEG